MNRQRCCSIHRTSQSHGPAVHHAGLRLQSKPTHSKRICVITAELLRGNAVLHERSLHLIAGVAVFAISGDAHTRTTGSAETDCTEPFYLAIVNVIECAPGHRESGAKSPRQSGPN